MKLYTTLSIPNNIAKGTIFFTLNAKESKLVKMNEKPQKTRLIKPYCQFQITEPKTLYS